MRCAFTREEIAAYTVRQLNAVFPDPVPLVVNDIVAGVDDATTRVEYCFRHVALPGYIVAGDASFDLYHTDQYCTYLGYLGNALWQAGADRSILGRVFALNKALHGMNAPYNAVLPSIVLLIHVVGTVLGRAEYRDYFVVAGGCTIGAIGGVFPTLSEGLIMSASSSIIGPGTIGHNVMLEPNVHVMKTDVPADVRVRGSAPHTFVPQADRGLRAFFHLPEDGPEALH